MASATETAAPPRGSLRRARRARPAASRSATRCARRRLPRRPRDHRRARGLGARPPRLLRDHPELDFKLFLDLCGVDYLDRTRDDRFEVVLHVYSVSKKHHVRLKTRAARGATPTLDTLTGVYKGANWFEREAWDLYGIVFEGHPNLRRILTHDAFVGHPHAQGLPHRASATS